MTETRRWAGLPLTLRRILDARNQFLPRRLRLKELTRLQETLADYFWFDN